MDILAHGLWAGLGVTWMSSNLRRDRRTLALTVALAVAPDLLQFLPLLPSALLKEGGWTLLKDYATAPPGKVLPLSPALAALTHHLHCLMHSALVAGAVTAVLWRWRGCLWIPLLGWWSHILIDVFTHSADFYPSPVFYPLSYWGFDGIAWNTPWFTAINYLSLAVAGAMVWRHKRARTGQASP
jgi:hypothetical protein